MHDEHKKLLEKIRIADKSTLEIITHEERNILRSLSLKEDSLLKSLKRSEEVLLEALSADEKELLKHLSAREKELLIGQEHNPDLLPLEEEETPPATPGSHVMLVIGLGGFLGANLRWLLSTLAISDFGTAFPWGTWIINITGCFMLGMFSEALKHLQLDDRWRFLVAVGFLGAYTTYSTFELDVFTLIDGGKVLSALLYVFMSFSVGFGGVVAGVVLMRGLLKYRFQSDSGLD